MLKGGERFCSPLLFNEGWCGATGWFAHRSEHLAHCAASAALSLLFRNPKEQRSNGTQECDVLLEGARLDRNARRCTLHSVRSRGSPTVLSSWWFVLAAIEPGGRVWRSHRVWPCALDGVRGAGSIAPADGG